MGNKRLVLSIIEELPSKAPASIQIFKEGANAVYAGEGKTRDVVLSAKDISDIIRKFSVLGRDLLIDYEHLSERGGAPANGKVIAAGWIKGLRHETGGPLMADVEWTDDATREIETRQYKYLSPVFYLDDKTGHPIELVSVTLTNDPATIGARALAADRQGIIDMIDKSILDKLGLPETATAEDVTKAIDAMKPAEPAAPTEEAATQVIASRLGIKDVKNAEDLRVSLSRVDPAKYVPSEHVEKLTKELADEKAIRLSRDRDKFIADGTREGKIVKASEPMWIDLFDKLGADGAAKHLATASKIVPTGGAITDNGGASDPQADRKVVISEAYSRYKSDPTANKICSKAEWFVQDALRDKGLNSNLTDDEKKLCAV